MLKLLHCEQQKEKSMRQYYTEGYQGMLVEYTTKACRKACSSGLSMCIAHQPGFCGSPPGAR